MTMLGDLVRDFRYAGRSLARSPGFTVIAVAVLALGIGATSAIFSLVSAVWLKPLPFADAERIVTLWVDLTAIGAPANVNLAPGAFVDWQERSQSFDSTFTADDGADEPVVVSEGFWLRRLNGDPAAVGRTTTPDGSPHLVVGVVPREFRFPNGEVDVFVPTVWASEALACATSYHWYGVVKLREGVSFLAAAAGRAAAASIVPLPLVPALRAASVNPMTALRAAG